MASSASIAVQASILARAWRQRLAPRGPCDGRASRSSRRLRRTTTSMPSRVSTRIAAALICGASTSLTQPASNATRPFCAAPRPGTICGASGRCGRCHGVRRSMAASRLKPDRLGEPRERLAHKRRPQAPAGNAVDKAKARERGAQQALERRPPVGVLDVGAGVVDEVHVVHAGRDTSSCRRGTTGSDRHAARPRPSPAGRSPACP